MSRQPQPLNTPFDADPSASREVAVATIGRTVEHARERKTPPDFREMVVDLLTEIERLTNYSTVVFIALSARDYLRSLESGVSSAVGLRQ